MSDSIDDCSCPLPGDDALTCAETQAADLAATGDPDDDRRADDLMCIGCECECHVDGVANGE